jgi:hypothetical protein
MISWIAQLTIGTAIKLIIKWLAIFILFGIVGDKYGFISIIDNLLGFKKKCWWWPFN